MRFKNLYESSSLISSHFKISFITLAWPLSPYLPTQNIRVPVSWSPTWLHVPNFNQPKTRRNILPRPRLMHNHQRQRNQSQQSSQALAVLKVPLNRTCPMRKALLWNTCLQEAGLTPLWSGTSPCHIRLPHHRWETAAMKRRHGGRLKPGNVIYPKIQAQPVIYHGACRVLEKKAGVCSVEYVTHYLRLRQSSFPPYVPVMTASYGTPLIAFAAVLAAHQPALLSRNSLQGIYPSAGTAATSRTWDPSIIDA